MTNLTNLTTDQLHRILAIKERIEKLHGGPDSIAGGGEILSPITVKAPKKRRMSPAARAKIAAGAKARWARVKGKAKSEPKPAKKGKVTAAGRFAIDQEQNNMSENISSNVLFHFTSSMSQLKGIL
jgi:hypothetical protein